MFNINPKITSGLLALGILAPTSAQATTFHPLQPTRRHATTTQYRHFHTQRPTIKLQADHTGW